MHRLGNPPPSQQVCLPPPPPPASKLAPHPEAGLPPPGYPMPRGWTDGSVGLASRAARRSRDIKGCQDLFGLPVHVSYPEGPDDDSFLLTGLFDLCPIPKPLLGHKCLPFRSLEGSPCSVGFFLCHRLPLARAPTSWGSALKPALRFEALLSNPPWLPNAVTDTQSSP